MQVLLPYSQGLLAKECHEKGRIVSEDYGPDGVAMTVVAPVTLQARLAPFVVQKVPDPEDAPTDGGGDAPSSPDGGEHEGKGAEQDDLMG